MVSPFECEFLNDFGSKVRFQYLKFIAEFHDLILYGSQQRNQISVVLKELHFCFFKKKIFFYVNHFKVLIEFATILLLFYVLVFWPWGMRCLSSLARYGTHLPYTGRWTLARAPPGKSLKELVWNGFFFLILKIPFDFVIGLQPRSLQQTARTL